MKRVVLSVILLIAALLVGYQLVDPGSRGPPPEVDQSASESERALRAVQLLAYGGYSYTVGKYQGSELTLSARVAVSHRTREMLVSVEQGSPHEEYYTDRGTWYRIGEGSDWKYTGRTGFHPATNPFDPEPLSNRDPDRIVSNGSTVSIRYESSALHELFLAPYENFFPGEVDTMTLDIDTTSGRLQRTRLELARSGQRQRMVYEFDYGRVNISRPKGVPRFSLKGLYHDLVDKYERKF